jgi:hypothetical protein
MRSTLHESRQKSQNRADLGKPLVASNWALGMTPIYAP